MKHSIAVKFLAFFLAALCLVSVFAGVMGIVAMEGADLYTKSLGELRGGLYKYISRTIAQDFIALYTAETLGDVPYTLKQSLFSDPSSRSDGAYWYLTVTCNEETVTQAGNRNAQENHAAAEIHLFSKQLYPIVSRLSPDELDALSATEDSSSRMSHSDPDPGRVPSDYLYCDPETVFSGGRLITYYLYYYQAPEYTVTVYMQEQVLENSSLHMLTTIYPYRYTCIAVLVAGLLLFAAIMVYLFLCAGVQPDGSISPAGPCRLPLDVYALLTVIAGALLISLYFYLNQWAQSEGPHPGNLSLMAVVLLAIALLGIGLIYAFAAQIKMKDGYLWKHSITGRCLQWLVWSIQALYGLLPVIWQWLVSGGIMGLSLFALFLLAQSGSGIFIVLFILDLLLCSGFVLYSAWCFASLAMGVQRMSRGDLGHKVSTRYLRGSFLALANSLNVLSQTAKTAAENEMRSERMRTELITNVSHDIKTPLTGIISFVDLLQKPHTPAQQGEYLEVLSRQSGRLKRLIDDLIELSKVSTGNITVSLAAMDMVETVNQALGEFSDKLTQAQLTPVFAPEHSCVPILADGRLVWRVLSNLLGNAVKYSLPGTRLYLDLTVLENEVLLSLKNISSQPLTVEATDLMERFVRGDASRGSDGSGLGLNIAKSLMELQGGQMQILLDGDLFKVTLSFPKA